MFHIGNFSSEGEIRYDIGKYGEVQIRPGLRENIFSVTWGSESKGDKSRLDQFLEYQQPSVYMPAQRINKLFTFNTATQAKHTLRRLR